MPTAKLPVGTIVFHPCVSYDGNNVTFLVYEFNVFWNLMSFLHRFHPETDGSPKHFISILETQLCTLSEEMPNSYNVL